MFLEILNLFRDIKERYFRALPINSLMGPFIEKLKIVGSMILSNFCYNAFQNVCRFRDIRGQHLMFWPLKSLVS